MLLIDYHLLMTARGETRTLQVQVDEQTMLREDPLPEPLPEWMTLSCQQCDHCPLQQADSPACPAALSLLPLVHEFSDTVSHEPVELTVERSGRKTLLSCTAQQAIGSLAGLLLATSGCPHLAFLRPLARYHVPLASIEETHLRAISSYLVGQYLRQQQGLEADFSCQGLTERYARLGQVNRRLAQRLRIATEKDSMVNAVVVLDMLAKTFSLSLDDLPAELNPLYQPYLDHR